MKKALAAAFAAAVGLLGATAFAEPYMDEYEVMMPSEMRSSDKGDKITREEFCDVIYRLLELRGAAPEKLAAQFNDTQDEIVGALCSDGIIVGYDERTFGAQDFLTREQTAMVICRVMDYLGIEDTEEVSGSFKDMELVSFWAAESVNRVGRSGIMKGYGEDAVVRTDDGLVYNNSSRFTLENSRFGPQDNYTREQAAITAYRIYTKQPVITGSETVWEVTDEITLYTNIYTTWAEVNGEVTLCTATPDTCVTNINDKIFYNRPLTDEMGNGEYGVALGPDLYSLESGKHIMGFYSDIEELTSEYVATSGDFKVTFLEPTHYRYFYDYSGKLFTRNGKTGPGGGSVAMKTYTDLDGQVHYMYYSNTEHKDVFTRANSLEMAFAYENMEDCGLDIFKTWSGEGESYECAVYTANGDVIYSGPQEVFVCGDLYAVRNEAGDGMKVCDIASGEYLYDVRGTRASGSGNYIFSNDKKTYNVYSKDMKNVFEGYDSIEVEKWKDEQYIVLKKDDRSWIYREKDFSLYLELEGLVSEITDDYIRAYIAQEQPRDCLYNHKGEVLVNLGMDYWLKSTPDYYYITNASGAIVFDKSFNIIRGFDGKQILILDEFVIADNEDDTKTVYNLKTGKSLTVIDKMKIYAAEGVVCIGRNDVLSDLKVYNAELIQMPTEVPGEVYASNLGGRCIKLQDKASERYLFDIPTMKIVKALPKEGDIKVVSLGDKDYAVHAETKWYGKLSGIEQTTLYDLGNPEREFTLPGEFSYETEYIVMRVSRVVADSEDEVGYFVYDNNGQLLGSVKTLDKVSEMTGNVG